MVGRTVWCLVMGLAWATARADAVDNIVRATMQAQGMPGASVIITQDGKVVKHTAYGISNLELDAKVTTDSVFEIGSITKQFTAMLVMQEVERGTLKLDSPLEKTLSELPTAWHGVTLRQCLNHTAGLPEYLGLGISLRADYGRMELLEKIGDRPLDFVPGLTWSYSNTGYLLAGMALERATGREWKELVAKRIFEPLGMRHSYVQAPSQVIKGRATGYAGGRRPLNAEILRYSTAYAAGAILSTTGDMAKWDAAQGSPALLSSAGWREIWNPAKLNSGRTYGYGLGWVVNRLHGVRAYGHGGNTFGFSSFFTKLPEYNLSVIVLANLGGVDLSELSWKIASAYLPKSSVQTRPSKPVEHVDPVETESLKRALNDVLERKLDSGNLDPELVAFLSTIRGRSFGPQLRLSIGKIKDLRILERTQEGTDTRFVVDIIGEKERTPAQLLAGPGLRLVRITLGG